MKARKYATYELDRCYAIAPLVIDGKDRILVAAEKVNDCILFDRGFPTFRSHLRMRPVSRRHSRRGLVGGSTFRRTPISRSPLDKNPSVHHSPSEGQKSPVYFLMILRLVLHHLVRQRSEQNSADLRLFAGSGFRQYLHRVAFSFSCLVLRFPEASNPLRRQTDFTVFIDIDNLSAMNWYE